MSLKSRSIVFLLFLSSALLAWSCGGEPQAPGGASSRFVITGPSAAQQQSGTDVPVFTESDETVPADEEPADETPAPAPGPGDPAPAPAPNPPPGPPKPPDPNQPFNPGPPPKPAPGALAPKPPNGPLMRIKVRIDPADNNVWWSGKPILDVPTCRDSVLASKNSWYYDQILSTESGVAVTITERANFFDGRLASTIKDSIKIPGNSGHTIHSRWCSGYRQFHFTQTMFKGQDDNGASFELWGPWVKLYP